MQEPVNVICGPIQDDIKPPEPTNRYADAVRELQPGQSRMILGARSGNLSSTAKRLFGRGNYRTKTTSKGVRIWRLA